MGKHWIGLALAAALLLCAGCEDKTTDPLLEGEWELIEGVGAERLDVAPDGGAFWDGEAVRWEIAGDARLLITHASRRTEEYGYEAGEAFLTLTAPSGLVSRYAHPDLYPADPTEHAKLAGLWTDGDGRLTLHIDAGGSGTRYGWPGVEDAAFVFSASEGRMRMAFAGMGGQWVQYAFSAPDQLEMLFEYAPDGGGERRAMWKMADPGGLNGVYTVLYDLPSSAEGPAVARISFDGKGGCEVNGVYGGYQYFANGILIWNARGTHLSLKLSMPEKGMLTLEESGLDHRYAAVLEDPSLGDAAALVNLAGIWSDPGGTRLLQIGPDGRGRVIWEGVEGAAAFRVVGEFLRVEPAADPEGYFYLCFARVGTVLYAARSAAYPGGYGSWTPLDKLY